MAKADAGLPAGWDAETVRVRRELGYGRVAVAYATYRGRRSALREQEATATEGGEQLELAAPALSTDLRARLSFARIGLNLTLSENELVARLLRSVSMSLTPQEQRETVS